MCKLVVPTGTASATERMQITPRNLHLVESISDFEFMVTRNTHDEMECNAVGTWVNNPSNDTPECLAPKKENSPDGT